MIRQTLRIGLLVLAALGTHTLPSSARQAPVPETQDQADGFLRALPGRPLSLPADHGNHPETRTEWWYVTGHLAADDGRPFGFQATWFRRAMKASVPEGRSPMAVRDVMLFHGALADVEAGTVTFDEQACRRHPAWADAASDGLDVFLLEHSLRATDEAARGATLRYRVRESLVELDLDLAAAGLLLHGEEPGLSRKGTEPGQASWYYSLTGIPVRGSIVHDGRRMEVSGRAWFDHEFGSAQLSADQVGWDWFSVVLDDDTELMAYQMRLADGAPDETSAMTLRTPGSEARHLPLPLWNLRAKGSWTSPRTNATYPSGWRLTVPGEDLVLDVVPVFPDQELSTPGSTGVTYWEGLCTYRGTREGRPVEGRGYVELVGYAASFLDPL